MKLNATVTTGINLTAFCRVSSCPNTDLIAEVAEAIFCLSCSRIIGINDYNLQRSFQAWNLEKEFGMGGWEEEIVCMCS